MSYRWIICPVVTITIPDNDGGLDDVFRAPKIHAYIEPGRNKRYQHTSAIHDSNWCLSLVKADDFTLLDADPEIINLLEIDFVDFVHFDLTLRQLGVNAARLTRIKNRMIARGVDVTGLTLDTPIETILDRIASMIAIWFRCRKLRL